MYLSRLRRTLANFTVLIEGGIDPQPHLGFINPSPELALSDSDGSVAGTRKDAALEALKSRVPALEHSGQTWTVLSATVGHPIGLVAWFAAVLVAMLRAHAGHRLDPTGPLPARDPLGDPTRLARGLRKGGAGMHR
jgi:hypothetical protein